MHETIRSAFAALIMNKMRTVLTMIGIIIGISSVILIYSIGQGAVAFVTNELTSFGTDYFQINPGKSQFNTIGGSASLTFDDLDAIKSDLSLTNIKKIAPFAFSSEVISGDTSDEEILTYGVTEEVVDILRPEIMEGEFLTNDQDASLERVVVIGSDVSENFFGIDASPIGETIQIKDKTFRIIGVAKSSSALAGGFINNAVFIPIHVGMADIFTTKALQEIDISVHDTRRINETMNDIELLLRNSHNLEEGTDNDFRIESAQDVLSTVQTVTGLLTSMIVAISGISLVVGGVGVMNIMLVSVTERTKEIGLLKAIGAKDRDILLQFLVEASIMTSFGGVIGVLLGISGAYLIARIISIPFVPSFFAIGMAVSVSTVVGLVFGLFPARRAANLSPIDALRYE